MEMIEQSVTGAIMAVVDLFVVGAMEAAFRMEAEEEVISTATTIRFCLFRKRKKIKQF